MRAARGHGDPDKRGRAEARALYPLEPCEVCGRTGPGRGTVDRHHRNSDRSDNRSENIAFLCRLHHLAAHRESDGRIGGGPRPRIVQLMRDRGHHRATAAHLHFDSDPVTIPMDCPDGVEPDEDDKAAGE